MCLQYKCFENTVGKGEIAHNKQFLLFPLCFLPFQRAFCHFHQIWNCCLQTLWVLKSLKFVTCEKVRVIQAQRVVVSLDNLLVRYFGAFDRINSSDWLNHVVTNIFSISNIIVFYYPLPNNKFLDWSKLKVLADEKINVTENLNLFLEG